MKDKEKEKIIKEADADKKKALASQQVIKK